MALVGNDVPVNLVPESDEQTPFSVPFNDANPKLQRLGLGVQVAANESHEVLTQQDKIIIMSLTGHTSSGEMERYIGGWNQENVRAFCARILRAYTGKMPQLEQGISKNIRDDGLRVTTAAVIRRIKQLEKQGNKIEGKPLPKIEDLGEEIFLDRKAAQREMNIYSKKVRKYPVGDGKHIFIRANRVPKLTDTRWYGKAGGRPQEYNNALINNKLKDKIGKEIPLERGNNDMDIYQEYIEGEGYVVSSYVKGKLHSVSYSTPGKEGGKGYSKTTVGSHPVTFFNQNHIVGAKVSRGATMGWAIFYGGKGFEGEAIHESPTVTGKPGSHGCVRLAGAYLRRLFKAARSIHNAGGKVVVHIIHN